MGWGDTPRAVHCLRRAEVGGDETATSRLNTLTVLCVVVGGVFVGGTTFKGEAVLAGVVLSASGLAFVLPANLL